MSGQATGRVTVKYDGNSLRSKPGASIDLGGVEQVVEMDDQGQSYVTEKVTPCVVKATMPHMAETDLPGLRGLKGLTVQYTTDTGVVYTTANASVLKVGELKNGEVEVSFGGDPAK